MAAWSVIGCGISLTAVLLRRRPLFSIMGELQDMKRKFTASVWREDDWYIAQALEVDVVSQGETEAEVLRNLAEAIELSFEPPSVINLNERFITLHTIEADI